MRIFFCPSVTCNLLVTACLQHFPVSWFSSFCSWPGSLTFCLTAKRKKKKKECTPTGVRSLVADIVRLLSRLHNTLQLIFWGHLHLAVSAFCKETTTKEAVRSLVKTSSPGAVWSQDIIIVLVQSHGRIGSWKQLIVVWSLDFTPPKKMWNSFKTISQTWLFDKDKWGMVQCA